MKNNFKIIIFYIVFIGIILVVTATLFNQMDVEEFTYSDIPQLFKEEKVKSFEIDKKYYLILNVRTVNSDGSEGEKTIQYRLSEVSLSVFWNECGELIREQYDAGIIEKYDFAEPVDLPWWISFLPYAILIILFVVLWFYVMNQAAGKGGKMTSFGRARAKLGSNEKKKVFFRDVAGAEEEKEELKEVVEFLRNPDHFLKLGARIPRGVLLVGPPGTGKTLLAKAVAGEAGVPFYSISGSDFVEMYVGVGASRVRDLFDTAKKNPASIIFIDEIDAVGRHRGAGLGGGHDEREQTLNQLLVEMDGFGNNEGVIVMAATNRPDILDPALLRPGRFDRQITVNYPDIKGREEILKVHAKGKPFEEDVDLSVVAKSTVGFTGADLANLLNEAAILAARKRKHLIGMNDLEEAMIKVIVGPQKRSKVVNEKEKKLTAYHEAGHAIVTKLIKSDDPVHQISIIPSGRAGGYTLSLPKEDRSYISKIDMQKEIVTLLGGRTAEMLILGDISTGASNDIQRATSIARNMVTKYGMSDKLGPIVYGTEHPGDEVFLGRDFSSTRNYSEVTASEIDAEIRAIIDDACSTAKTLLEENIDKLHFIAEFLMKNETMDEAQFEAAMGGNPTFEELENLVAEKKRKSEEENRIRAEYEKKELARREKEARKIFEETHNLPPQDQPDKKDPPPEIKD
ncbi:MAG: ATP-dependent zinc metalloprotease FtsH [Clostridiales bacterium]|nr:ATP-dependent zinc metalloprotease FtsH [Clostridiales bacterium]